MKPLEPHEAGYIRRLIERALTDPESVRRELEAKLEAKEHLSLAEFNILEALKQCKEVRSCKYCGRPFAPRWKNQKYCSKTCRIVYHSVRYKRKWKEYLRMKHRWRSMKDPSYREKWMSRLNKLRAKEGRLPYWFTGKGRPYTKDELGYMRTTGRIPVKGGEEAWQHYLRRHLGQNETLLKEWQKGRPEVFVMFRRKEADTPSSEGSAKSSEAPPSFQHPQTYVRIHDSALGCDVTYKIPIKPNEDCSHKNSVPVWVGQGSLGFKRRALVCQKCGAIKFLDRPPSEKENEGDWQYSVDADIHATPLYRGP